MLGPKVEVSLCLGPLHKSKKDEIETYSYYPW